MDKFDEQRKVWARFQAFIRHRPSEWDEVAVSEFHEIVSALESAFAADLSSFRIPERQMYRSAVSGERYLNDIRFAARQIEGIGLYFQNLNPPPQPPKIGFS